jgi:hypothetical protein
MNNNYSIRRYQVQCKCSYLCIRVSSLLARSPSLKQCPRSFLQQPCLSPPPSVAQAERCYPSGFPAEQPTGKEGWTQAPAAAAAQNVLMRKLGLAGSDHVESADFDHYISLFRDGLFEEQAKLIDMIFMDNPPPGRGCGRGRLTSTAAFLVVLHCLP